MSTRLKIISPILLIILGIILLLFLGQAIPAGVCFLVGTIMVVESLWPEKREAEKRNN